MAQVVFLRHLNQGDRVQFEAIPCGICGGKSDNETGFSPSTSTFSCRYHSPVLHACSLVCHRWCIILVHRVKNTLKYLVVSNEFYRFAVHFNSLNVTYQLMHFYIQYYISLKCQY